jgi:pimeloyl-ACP methyl ester carboxylesterase
MLKCLLFTTDGNHKFMNGGTMKNKFTAAFAALFITLSSAAALPAPALAAGITPGGVPGCNAQTVNLPVAGALTAVNPQTGATRLVNGSGDIHVATEFCNQGPITSHTVVVTLHGAARDHRLFNPPTSTFDQTHYNLVWQYTHSGLPVVNLDRVGAGASEKPLPSTAVNLTSEARAYSALVAKLRAGTYRPGVPAFSKVVLVGHSYGASVANEMSAFHDLTANPALPGSPDTHTNGTILISFRHPAPNPAGVAALGLSILPATPLGYIQANPAVAQQLEFNLAYADPAIVSAAAGLGSTATDGQLSTFPLSFSPLTAAAVTNPVLVNDGEQDPIMCSTAAFPGTFACDAATLTSTESSAYPNAANVSVIVQPLAAHLPMWHPNASASFVGQIAWIHAHV